MNNIPMALSTYTSKAPEDVIKQGKGNPYMMHVCFFKDRNKTLEIIKRAEGRFNKLDRGVSRKLT